MFLNLGSRILGTAASFVTDTDDDISTLKSVLRMRLLGGRAVERGSIW